MKKNNLREKLKPLEPDLIGEYYVFGLLDKEEIRQRLSEKCLLRIVEIPIIFCPIFESVYTELCQTGYFSIFISKWYGEINAPRK